MIITGSRFLFTSILQKLTSIFLEGTFQEGLEIVADINEQLKEYELYLDQHRILVFYYKIASLYFGAAIMTTRLII